MGSTWKHPELGQFKYDGMEWERVVDTPAFKAFKYDDDDGDSPRGKCVLAFEADDENEKPSAAAVAVALKVLGAQAELVTKMIKALWEDFNGRGPESGMWWHGDLDEVANGLEDADLPPPRRAEDLLKLMRPFKIVVRKRVEGYEKPIVELSFAAAFEEEHNVGVLTDGKKIIGTGYQIDVRPFRG